MSATLRLPLAAFCEALLRPLGARRALRHERELVAALGEPLLAAHPAGRPAVRALAGQLAEYWFAGSRRVLPIVDLAGGEGAATLACELARALASMDRRTLLVDANLRSPRLHARFGVRRGGGIADFLDARPMQLAPQGGNLALLTAGTAHEHPLELLSRARLRGLLGTAAQSFDAVLVATAPVARGPDFEIFAALAGGALVFVGEATAAAALAALRRRLLRCAARVVGTVLEHS